MTKSNKLLLLIGLAVLAFLAVAAGVGGFFFLRQNTAAETPIAAPTAEEDILSIPPIPPSNLLVHLTSPNNETQIAPGDSLSIHGQVVSNYPVQALELWVNGEKVEDRIPPVGKDRNFFIGIWDWQARESGVYPMVLRGLDKYGNSLYSNMVNVVVEGPALQENGEKVLPVIDAAQVTPAPTSEVPSSGDPGTSTGEGAGQPDPGTPGLPSPQTNPPDAGQPEPQENPPPTEEVPQEITPDPGQTLGEPPEPVPTSFNLQIEASQNGCDHIFKVKDLNNQATRYILYHLDFWSGWEPVYSIKAEPEGVSIKDGSSKSPGTHSYYIKAIGEGSQMFDSAIYKLETTDSSCLGSVEDLTVFADVKVVSRVRTENMHCYSRLNENDWDRLPLQGYLQPLSKAEKDAWKTNLKVVDPAITEPSANELYDLLPYIPSLGATGRDTWKFSVKCFDTVWNEEAKPLGLATGQVDMKQTDKVVIMRASNFDVVLFFASKTGQSATQKGYNLQIAAPTQLEILSNMTSCPTELHLNKTACEEMIANNYVFFRWNWKSKPCANPDMSGSQVCIEEPFDFWLTGPQSNEGTDFLYQPSPDGFYYAVLPYPVNIQTPGSSSNGSLSDTIDALSHMAIYHVNAQGSGLISRDSNFVVLDVPPVQHFMTLFMTGSSRYITGADESGMNNGYPGPGLPPARFVYSAWNFDRDPAQHWIQHGKFKYDLTPLQDKNIIKAELKLDVVNSSGYACGESGFNPFGIDTSACGVIPPANGCSQMLTYMTEGFVGGVHASAPQTSGAHHLYTASQTFDVTDEIRMWLDGTLPNYGFLLWTEPYFEMTGEWLRYGCNSYYEPTLSIEYQDK